MRGKVYSVLSTRIDYGANENCYYLHEKCLLQIDEFEIEKIMIYF